MKSIYTYLDTSLALENIGDEDAMIGMLEMLKESLGTSIPEISISLQNGQVQEASRLLHHLKGFIPIFCSNEICAGVIEVELLSKDKDSKIVLKAYIDLKPKLEALLKDVETHLSPA